MRIYTKLFRNIVINRYFTNKSKKLFRRATKHGECMRGAQEFECCDELDTIEIPEHKIITNIDIASVLTQLCNFFDSLKHFQSI